MSTTFAKWIYTTWPTVLMVVLSAAGIYITLMVCTRIAGLRSFSKMSSFDFALTVAIGSIIASSLLTDSPPLLQAVVALATVFGLQFIVSRSRASMAWVQTTIDNQPMLLMAGTEVLEQNMSRARVSKNDLRAKLREANVTSLDQVYAVVMESTGDISVLHRESDSDTLDTRLLNGVIGREHMD